MGVGLRIKKILREKKLTIKQLAELSGIPLNTLYSITKRDSERVDRIILQKIALSLEVSEDDLIGIKPLPKKGSFGTDALQASFAADIFMRKMGYTLSIDYSDSDDDIPVCTVEDEREGVTHVVSLSDIQDIEEKLVLYFKFLMSEYTDKWKSESKE